MELIPFSRGKASEVFVSDLAAPNARATEPADVTITVAVPADAGATSVELRCVTPLTLRRGLILVFTDGTPDEDVLLIVTEDTAITDAAGTVPVDRLVGEEDAGIELPLSAGHTALWDQLHRVFGTESAAYSLTDQLSVLNPATYESKFIGATWSEDEATSKSATIPREGLFNPHDHAYELMEDASHEEREVWVKVVYPDADGIPARLFEGRSKVRNFAVQPPASDLVRCTWTWNLQGKPKRVKLVAPGSGS